MATYLMLYPLRAPLLLIVEQNPLFKISESHLGLLLQFTTMEPTTLVCSDLSIQPT